MKLMELIPLTKDQYHNFTDVKRLLGKSFDDDSVKKFAAMHSFPMISVANKPVLGVTHDGKV